MKGSLRRPMYFPAHALCPPFGYLPGTDVRPASADRPGGTHRKESEGQNLLGRIRRIDDSEDISVFNRLGFNTIVAVFPVHIEAPV